MSDTPECDTPNGGCGDRSCEVMGYCVKDGFGLTVAALKRELAEANERLANGYWRKEYAAMAMQVDRLVEERNVANEKREDAERRLSHSRIPDGWKLVPVEPTREMLAPYKSWYGAGNAYMDVTIWKEMIAAAPEPPKEGT